MKKFEAEVKMNCLDNVLIMSLMVLADEFNFKKEELDRFKKRFCFKSECIADDYTTWKDMQEILMEEADIDTCIRNTDLIKGA